jgi:hypothetical protein
MAPTVVAAGKRTVSTTPAVSNPAGTWASRLPAMSSTVTATKGTDSAQTKTANNVVDLRVIPAPADGSRRGVRLACTTAPSRLPPFYPATVPRSLRAASMGPQVEARSEPGHIGATHER